MPRFSSPQKQGQKQAAHVMKQLQGTVIRSVGTVRNYEQALRNVGTRLAEKGDSLKALTPQTAQAYLEVRSEELAQKSLDMERQAIQTMMRHITGHLAAAETLPVIKSVRETVLEARAYTAAQVAAITAHQAPQNVLATEIAYAAGLRAHELITLRPLDAQHPDNRPALPEKFQHREGVRYSVVGKGGLVREVSIPARLATQLEARRISPQRVTDRGIHYTRHYNLGGGRHWSASFSRASKLALGWSTGAHGLRHSYAQERMDELRYGGLDRDHALTVVSQEMGHFRPEITEVYLR